MKEIVGALYGANETYSEVGHIISYLILGNEKILVSNLFFGDPIPGIQKQLIILYSDGHTTIHNENVTMIVSDDYLL